MHPGNRADIRNMSAQGRCACHERNGFGAAPLNVIDSLSRSPAIRGNQRRRRLALIIAIRNHGEDHRVGFCEVTTRWASAGFHHIGGYVVENPLQIEKQSVFHRLLPRARLPNH